MGELIKGKPIFLAKNNIELLGEIIKFLGMPLEEDF